MLQTNLVIVPAISVLNGSGGAQATMVDICEKCGGLFARPGGQFLGQPHFH